MYSNGSYPLTITYERLQYTTMKSNTQSASAMRVLRSGVVSWENENGIRSVYSVENVPNAHILYFIVTMFTFLVSMYRCPSDMQFLQLTLHNERVKK